MWKLESHTGCTLFKQSLEAGPLRIPVEMCIPIGVEAAHAGPVDYF